MTGIEQLPEELIEQILQYVHPLDLINFVSAQRRLHRIASGRLAEYRKNMRMFGQITITDEDDERRVPLKETYFEDPIDLMIMVQHDPWIVSYPRCLIWDYFGDPIDHEHVWMDNLDLSTIKKCTRTPAADDVLLSDCIEDMMQHLLEGARSLTLFVLWNMRKLVLNIAGDWFDPKDILHVLTNLKEVVILSSNVPLIMIERWACLPAIESLTLIGEGYSLTNEKITATRSASLTELKLVDCDLKGDGLYDMLSSLAGLKSFCIENQYSSDLQDWSIDQTMQALECCALSSLESLTLWFSDISHSVKITIDQFKRLKHFRGLAIMLPHRMSIMEGSDKQDLQIDIGDCFPAGIVSISLTAPRPSIHPTCVVSLANMEVCQNLAKFEIDADAVTIASRQALLQRDVEFYHGRLSDHREHDAAKPDFMRYRDPDWN